MKRNWTVRRAAGGRADALLSQERQLEASARERAELATIADSIEEFCERLRAGLADTTFEQKHRLVELLIDWVIVNDEEEVEIRYVVPTSPEGPHQPFCHLRTDVPLREQRAHLLRREATPHPRSGECARV
jgi:site-specific DNA recombinase